MQQFHDLTEKARLLREQLTSARQAAGVSEGSILDASSRLAVLRAAHPVLDCLRELESELEGFTLRRPESKEAQRAKKFRDALLQQLRLLEGASGQVDLDEWAHELSEFIGT